MVADGRDGSTVEDPGAVLFETEGKVTEDLLEPLSNEAARVLCCCSDPAEASSIIFGSTIVDLELGTKETSDPEAHAERGAFPQASGLGQEAHAGATVLAESPSARQKALPKSSSLHAGQLDGSPEHVGTTGLICQTLPVVDRRVFLSLRGTDREDPGAAPAAAGSGEGRRIWKGMFPLEC